MGILQRTLGKTLYRKDYGYLSYDYCYLNNHSNTEYIDAGYFTFVCSCGAVHFIPEKMVRKFLNYTYHTGDIVEQLDITCVNCGSLNSFINLNRHPDLLLDRFAPKSCIIRKFNYNYNDTIIAIGSGYYEKYEKLDVIEGDYIGIRINIRQLRSHGYKPVCSDSHHVCGYDILHNHFYSQEFGKTDVRTIDCITAAETLGPDMYKCLLRFIVPELSCKIVKDYDKQRCLSILENLSKELEVSLKTIKDEIEKTKEQLA